MAVTKAQLLRGTAHVEELYVPEFETDGCGGTGDDCDGIVKVRPLSDGELGEADAAGVSGQIVRGPAGGRPTDSEVDVVKSATGQQLARRIRVAYGMSVDETWKPAEIAKLPPPGVRRVDAAVKRLTGGGGLEDEARTFRDDRPGSDDGGPAPDGDAAGEDAG